MSYTLGVKVVGLLEHKYGIRFYAAKGDVERDIDHLAGYPDSKLSIEEVIEKIRPLGQVESKEE